NQTILAPSALYSSIASGTIISLNATVNSASGLTFSTQKDVTVNALVVTTSVSSPSGGTVTGGGTYPAGATITLRAFASPGYVFVNFTNGSTVVSTSSIYSFTTSTSVSIVANFAPAGPTPTRLGNISTRMNVQTNDNVMIGGFIITGGSGSTKKVAIRGLGPSLNVNGTPVPGRMSDPLMELHLPDGSVVTNDNWRDAPNLGEFPNNLLLGDDRESMIVATLAPGGYTVIVKGAHGETGVGLVEVYDLDQESSAKLANISTRGFVQTNDNVMIGGFIVTGDAGSTKKVIVRALGPSLNVGGVPVAGRMADPTLELFDGNGTSLGFNDNWRSNQEAEINLTGLPPPNDAEPAIIATLPPGGTTAIVRGKDNSTGVALVEVYALDQ
ncbi:MAG: InlB B-repeat-containing protein, partial [Chthoniobacterales bacterium]